MLPFGVTIPATVPQGSEIPEGLMNNPVHLCKTVSRRYKIYFRESLAKVSTTMMNCKKK
jgi:hypothetical protein